MQKRTSIIFSLLLLSAFASTAHAATTPNVFLYEGRLLNSSSAAITTAHTFRFSFWKSADNADGDIVAGAINTLAGNYGGWNEEQTVTPNSNGIFSVALGSGSALPVTDFESHKYIMVEVKAQGAADTAYEIIDPETGNPVIDRMTIGSLPYAENAEALDHRSTGTASGNILVLKTGAVLRAPANVEIVGTASGASLHAEQSVTSSGTLSVDGASNLQGASTFYNTAIFNENGNAINFRIEGDNEENLFFVDGTSDRVGIKTSSPETALDVAGTISGSLITQNGAGNNYFMGNVGIGTTGPGAKLHAFSSSASVGIHSESTLNTGVAYVQAKNDTGGTSDFAYFGSTAAGTRLGINRAGAGFFSASQGMLGVGTLEANDLVFGTNNAENVRIKSGGNVGIGTTAPSSPAGFTPILHINGTYPSLVLSATSAGGRKYSVGSNTIAGAGLFEVYDETATAHRFVIDSSGNVGIGTTSPDRLLHAESSTALTNTVSYAQRLSHITSGVPANSIGVGLEFEQETAADNNEIGAIIEAVATDTTATSEDFDIVFKNMAAGAAAAETMRISSAGNLTVAGTQTFTGNGTFSGNLTVDGNTTLGSGTEDSITINADAITIANDTDVTLSGGVNGLSFDSTTLSIDAANDRVGIGTTGPLVKLHITQAADTNYPTLGTTKGGFLLAGDSDLYGLYSGINTNSGTAWFQAMRNDAATAYNILLNPVGGNVGIGTTGPGSALDVRASSTPYIIVGISGDNTSRIFTWVATGNGDFATGTVSGDAGLTVDPNRKLFLGERNSAETMVLYNGNVGIGTTAPGAKLDIVTENPATTDAGLFTAYSTDSRSPLIRYRKARGTLASPSIVASGDIAGEVLGMGYDGSAFLNAGDISIEIDGTPGAADMPGRIVFYTTPDGSTSLTERMRITNAGNVGIGTTGPEEKLEVVGTISGATLHAQDTVSSSGGMIAVGNIVSRSALSGAYITAMSGANSYALGNFGVGTSSPAGLFDVNGLFTVLPSGNVGIGTTAPGATLPNTFASHADSRALEIRSQSNSYDAGLFLRRADDAVGLDLWADNGNGYGYVDSRMYGTYFRVDTNATPNTVMYLSDRLITIGDGASGGNYNDSIVIGQSASDGGFLNSVALGRGATVTANNQLMIGSASYGLDTIIKNGNVGIGTTGPSEKLEVVGTLSGATLHAQDTVSSSGTIIATGNIESRGTLTGANITAMSGANSYALGNFGVGTSSPAGLFDVNGLFTVQPNGNVGIGTTGPSGELHVKSAASQHTDLIIDTTTDDYASGLYYYEAGSAKSGIIHYGDPTNGVEGGLQFLTGGITASTDTRMVIDSSGNVGIGTTGPTKTLTVSGTTLFDNDSGTGSVAISGTNGGHLCIEDTDVGGYTVVNTLNGTLNSRIAMSGECP